MDGKPDVPRCIKTASVDDLPLNCLIFPAKWLFIGVLQARILPGNQAERFVPFAEGKAEASPNLPHTTTVSPPTSSRKGKIWNGRESPLDYLPTRFEGP